MAEDQGTRYDRIAGGYARYWAPVIRPAALRLLDDLAPLVPAGAPNLIDIGTGTGTLAFGALERWPNAKVTGIDASSEMVAWAAGEAPAQLPTGSSDRFATAVSFADRLPFEDATFDLGMSSFVMQLVPNRAAALREARRVLRPGAPFGYATWLRESGEVDPPDRILDEVLDEFGFDPPEADSPSGDPATARAAADGMRRAGFREVTAREGVLTHRWTVRGYADFIEHFSEESLFGELVERERRALRHRLVERLRRLPARDMRLRLPVVYVIGRAQG
ncbi:MAG: class I SAM-dependent methyltransferase [Chloroflexi bacterium]|nr:class I SAM-dependent methyltransferase [Chloroflexota bacterium]